MSEEKKVNAFHGYGFYRDLNVKRVIFKLEWSDIAQKLDIDSSVFIDMENGKMPCIETLSKLTRWAGLSLDCYIKRSSIQDLPKMEKHLDFRGLIAGANDSSVAELFPKLADRCEGIGVWLNKVPWPERKSMLEHYFEVITTLRKFAKDHGVEILEDE